MRKRAASLFCDTKFEFGLDEEGILTLMDEVLTPDSEPAFWPAKPISGRRTESAFVRQAIRAAIELDKAAANKQAPAPKVPAEVIEKTVAKYREALSLLTAG